MEERSLKSMWKTVLIVVVAVVGMILYVFVSSAIAGRNDSGKTADMYGVDSLEYVAEPVMKIYVWQRNEKNPDDYPDEVEKYGVNSRLFFDLVPLTLKEGEVLSTSRNLFDDACQNTYTAVTVEYDGTISGCYEIPLNAFLYYEGGKDRIPAKPLNLGGGNTSEFSSGDGTFVLDDTATLLFPVGYYEINYKTDADMRIALKQRVGESEYDILKHLSTEKLTDVYPEASDLLDGVYRYKFTSQMTIHAKHPTKTDVVVATAVLEIVFYSKWRWNDSASLDLFRDSGYPDQAYSDIIVVSYEQSDMFAFE